MNLKVVYPKNHLKIMIDNGYKELSQMKRTWFTILKRDPHKRKKSTVNKYLKGCLIPIVMKETKVKDNILFFIYKSIRDYQCWWEYMVRI